MPLMTSEDLEALKADMAKARKKDIGFGLCLGKKPENTVMYLDKLKTPEVTQRKAKKAGETGKVACGMVSLKGKKCYLTLEGDVLPGMSKGLRKFFSSAVGMKLSVLIMDASGAQLEADLDEDDAAQEDKAVSEGAEGSDALAPQWEKVSAKLMPLVKAFVATGDARGPAVAKAWAGAQMVARKGNYKSALTAAAKIQPVLSTAKAAETSPPADQTAIEKSKVLWVNTRKSMLSEIQRLESEIVRVCSAIPDAAHYVPRARKMKDMLAPFDNKLQLILDEIVKTPEGKKRSKLKNAARSKVADYQSALEDDFFKDVDANNGFTKVNVTGAASKSLRTIDKVLSA